MSTPAGWYPDPAQADTQRYWDGDVWTDHGPAAPSLSPSSNGPFRGILAVPACILIAVVVVMFAYWMVTADDELTCATYNTERAAVGEPLLDCPE
jgi:hypothetical protein